MIIVLIVSRVMQNSLFSVLSHTSFMDSQYMSSATTTIRWSLNNHGSPWYSTYVQLIIIDCTSAWTTRYCTNMVDVEAFVLLIWSRLFSIRTYTDKISFTPFRKSTIFVSGTPAISCNNNVHYAVPLTKDDNVISSCIRLVVLKLP